MALKQLFVAAPAILPILVAAAADAKHNINEAGAIVCVTDKWDETEIENDHKLAEFVGRCVVVPGAAIYGRLCNQV